MSRNENTKAETLDEKIQRIRKKNEEIEKRRLEVEADREIAVKHNAVVQLTPTTESRNILRLHDMKSMPHAPDIGMDKCPDDKKVQFKNSYAKPNGPPPDPAYRFLADTERDLNPRYNFRQGRKSSENMGYRDTSIRGEKTWKKKSHDKQKNAASPDYEAWRAERNKIDEERINRQKTAEGLWKREWDNQKSEEDWKAAGRDYHLDYRAHPPRNNSLQNFIPNTIKNESSCNRPEKDKKQNQSMRKFDNMKSEMKNISSLEGREADPSMKEYLSQKERKTESQEKKSDLRALTVESDKQNLRSRPRDKQTQNQLTTEENALHTEIRLNKKYSNLKKDKVKKHSMQRQNSNQQNVSEIQKSDDKGYKSSGCTDILHADKRPLVDGTSTGNVTSVNADLSFITEKHRDRVASMLESDSLAESFNLSTENYEIASNKYLKEQQSQENDGDLSVEEVITGNIIEENVKETVEVSLKSMDKHDMQKTNIYMDKGSEMCITTDASAQSKSCDLIEKYSNSSPLQDHQTIPHETSSILDSNLDANITKTFTIPERSEEIDSQESQNTSAIEVIEKSYHEHNIQMTQNSENSILLDIDSQQVNNNTDIETCTFQEAPKQNEDISMKTMSKE